MRQTTIELGPEEPQSRWQPAPSVWSAKLPLSRRLRYWLWGGFEVQTGEGSSWQITRYRPGPGAKLADLARYFGERWKEFLFGVAGGIAVALVLALLGLG
jgi:hypothetical protein